MSLLNRIRTLLRWSSLIARRTRPRRSHEQPPAVSEDQIAPVRPIGAIPRAIADHRDLGADGQRALTKDKRYEVSAYTGHNGWIDLDIEDRQDWPEIERHVAQSYRKFALARMRKALDAGG